MWRTIEPERWWDSHVLERDGHDVSGRMRHVAERKWRRMVMMRKRRLLQSSHVHVGSRHASWWLPSSVFHISTLRDLGLTLVIVEAAMIIEAGLILVGTLLWLLRFADCMLHLNPLLGQLGPVDLVMGH